MSCEDRTRQFILKYNSDDRDNSEREHYLLKTRKEQRTEIDDLEEYANGKTQYNGIRRTVASYEDEINLAVDKTDIENSSNELRDESEISNDVTVEYLTRIDERPIQN